MCESMADNKKKQLVLVIEGTAALAPYWHPILFDYLYKVIRSFCDDESAEIDSPNVELALVVFDARGSCISWLLHQTDWTNDVTCFLKWLSCIEFSASSFCDAAIAEGLAQALTMFPSSNGSQTQQDEGLRRHCILVAASNPDSRQLDSETVAKSFPQACVSLSVICPKQLPKLKAIYNAGKRNPLAADPSIDIVRNPQYLVLISETFKEACDALSPSGITNPSSDKNHVKLKLKTTPIPQTVTSSGQSSIWSILGLRPIGANNDVETNVGTLSQQTLNAEQSGFPRYVKVWEGDLYGKQQGQPVLVTKLEAYRSFSESLAKDWPPIIQIDSILSGEGMDSRKEQYARKADFIVFRAMNQHGLFEQLENQCTVIKLPSETLILSVTDKSGWFLGMLFPVHLPQVFKPQVFEQQPAPSQHWVGRE